MKSGPREMSSEQKSKIQNFNSDKYAYIPGKMPTLQNKIYDNQKNYILNPLEWRDKQSPKLDKLDGKVDQSRNMNIVNQDFPRMEQAPVDYSVPYNGLENPLLRPNLGNQNLIGTRMA